MAELIVLMGPTGAGKSVQGDLLAADLDGVHLSSGELLRRDPQAAAMIANGLLAPAAEVERIVGEAIDDIPADKPIVFDGVIRTMSNAQWMERQLPKYGRTLRKVVLIELDFETLMKRLDIRHRADDTPEAVRAKWNEYIEKTQPVIEYYEATGLLVRIDGRGDVESVHSLVKAAIK
jgi:adenylate kinase